MTDKEFVLIKYPDAKASKFDNSWIVRSGYYGIVNTFEETEEEAWLDAADKVRNDINTEVNQKMNGILDSFEKLLPELNVTDRMKFFEKINEIIRSKYCIHCGCDNPRCQCNNDE